MKVSVIVPIYGVEKFIGHCADSLFKQTLNEIEYIFVNDATRDKSMEILDNIIKKYPLRQSQIRIIHHEQNKGLPAARNTGISAASGEFIFHCDGDDFVNADMLEKLYETACKNNADIVWCDWYLSYQNSERYMCQPKLDTPIDAVKAMLSGGMKYNVWNKLVKSSLYKNNNIRFPNGYSMGEDLTMIMLFSKSKKIVYFNKAFYHYVQTNENSLCKTYSKKHLSELKYNINRIETFIQNEYGSTMQKEIAFLKLEAKFPFLISDGSNGYYQIWKDWYPEANPYILKNKYISTRSKFIQWCASKNLFFIVNLYYKIIIKYLYTFLYK